MLEPCRGLVAGKLACLVHVLSGQQGVQKTAAEGVAGTDGVANGDLAVQSDSRFRVSVIDRDCGWAVRHHEMGEPLRREPPCHDPDFGN